MPYVEGIPHLGNLVGSILPADVYFKYLEMKGEDAIFVCGSDEHGTPIELQAIRKHIEAKALAGNMHREVKNALEKFECKFTIYGETNCEENKETVYEIFKSLDKNGYIKKIESEQAYCNIDKRFLSDRFIEGTCPYCGYDSARGDQCDNCGRLLTPKELIKPHCTICGKSDITFRNTTNLAFDMPKLQDKIESFINENSKNNWSKNAINHSLGYIKKGLDAREITRDLTWGFSVPAEGMQGKVFYVWFDAVIGYIGITRAWDNKKWLDYWKGDSILVQFMGKDNIEFHTLLWPGILIGSGLGYVLPHTIYAYEYLLSKGIKFSKSRGIGLNIMNALEVMEADYWRFALISMLPETSDSEFTIDALSDVINKDMNNTIGNFMHRVFTLVYSFADGKVPEVNEVDKKGKEILAAFDNQVKEYESNFEHIRLREALRNVVAIANLGNSYISEEAPWKLDKNSAGYIEKINNVLYVALNAVYKISIMLYPFTPAASLRAMGRFGISKARLSDLGHMLEGGMKLSGENVPLFKKFGEEEIKKLDAMK